MFLFLKKTPRLFDNENSPALRLIHEEFIYLENFLNKNLHKYAARY